MDKSITIKLTEAQRKKLREATGEDQPEVKIEQSAVSSRVAPRKRLPLARKVGPMARKVGPMARKVGPMARKTTGI